MNILITGGSGFIAVYAILECIKRGFHVFVQTRSTDFFVSSVPSSSITYLRKSFLELTPECFPSLDAILHLASAGVSPQKAPWNELIEINVNGTLAICRLAQLTDARLVVAGSYAEYGKSGLIYSPISVDSPLEPVFPYAVSKALSSHLAIGYAKTEGLDLGYLRIFNAYGDGQHIDNLWPSLREAAVSGLDFNMTLGEQVRDFVCVEKVASSLIDVLTEVPLRKGSPFVANIASGNPQSVKEFCTDQWSLLSARGRLNFGVKPYRKDEIMYYVPCMLTKYL